MKIFGHPVHMMLVHFPSALFPADLACNLISRYSGNLSFVPAGFYAVCGGVILGWLAVVFGCLDLVKALESHPPVIQKILVHGGVNTTVITGYTVIGALEFKHYPRLEENGGWLLAIKCVLIGFMIIGNFAGATLILKHKVAVSTGNESAKTL